MLRSVLISVVALAVGGSVTQTALADGACCLGNGNCLVLTGANCDLISDSRWQGDETDCTDLDEGGLADICEDDRPKIYWRTGDELLRADLDMTNVESTDLTYFDQLWNSQGIAIDQAAGKIYFVGADRIVRTNLNGSEAELLAVFEELPVLSIEVSLDLSSRKIYWSIKNIGGEGQGIYRANMDIPEGHTPESRPDIQQLFEGTVPSFALTFPRTCGNTPTDVNGDDDIDLSDFAVFQNCLTGPCDCDDADPCTSAACVNGGCVFTPIECPVGESCVDGECVPTDLCTTVADCGDGDLCTDDACVNSVCEFTAVSCPQGETCDPQTGGCVLIDCFNDAGCDDDDLCTTDICLNGLCTNDVVACTGLEVCDPDTGTCVPIDCTSDANCDDDLHCNGVETCVNNLCTDGTAPCDDGIECTDDTCDEGTQTCGNVTNNANCSDNATCSSDVCDPNDAGADPDTGCVFTNINGNCTDQFTCTVNTCDPENVDAETVTGCVFTTDDAACDDGVGCTTDTCDPADAGTDPNTGCVLEPDDASCDNGTVCDGVERCDLVNGCESPGNPCTGTTPICDGTPDACAMCADDADCVGIGETTCDLGTGSCS